MQTKQFIVFGRVQGVGFRFFTLQEAGKVGLNGTVRNREDGSVEVIAQGSAEQVEKMKAWLQKGPPTSVVDRLVEMEVQAVKIYENFAIVR